jgi:tRNA dimethylallyltransferase
MIDTRPILIAGPTASGKSALALALAEQLGGVVINADSMQVYRELRVLSARPPAEDEARVPHVLYGHVPGREAYSAARFAREARDAIQAAREQGLVPIVVGGTGLYFKALLEGLSPIPAVPDDVRAHWRGEADRIGAPALHAILKDRDPSMAERLKPTDPQRLVRALEVLEATGRSLAEWQQEPGEPVLRAEGVRRLVIMPDREELRRRCDARFDLMMAGGALDEVSALVALGLDPDLPVMRALGVRPLAELLAGEINLEDATQKAKAETRQYAKRQVTWLNGNMSAWKWFSKQEMKSLAANPALFVQSMP